MATKQQLVKDERTPVAVENTKYVIPLRWASFAAIVRAVSDPAQKWLSDEDVVRTIIISGGDTIRASRKALLLCRDRASIAHDVNAVTLTREKIDLLESDIDLHTIIEYAKGR